MTAKKNSNSLGDINRKYGDPWIWGIFAALIVISIVENYSASSQLVAETHNIFKGMIKHCGFLLAGAFMAFKIAKQDYNKPKFLAISIPLLGLVTLVMLVLLLFSPIVNGAQRAIHVAGMTFQPTELSKLSIVTLTAYFVAKYQKGGGLTNGGMIWCCAAMGIYCGLMYQSGLTNCIIVAAVAGSMMLIGGAPLKKLIAVLFAAGLIFFGIHTIKSNGNKNDKLLANANSNTELVAPAASETLTPADTAKLKQASAEPTVDRDEMRGGRILNWLNSSELIHKPLNDNNRQEILSRMAQAHGGVIGVGLGQSRECARLPLAFSDYVYSIIIEEVGVVGGIVVLILFLSLLGRAMIIVRKCHRAMPSLLIIGLASLITIQALVHMAINTGAFPVSGQPLPLLSQGGTAILTMCAAFGIMLSVSRTVSTSKATTSTKREEQEIEAELPEELNAENPSEIIPKNVWK